MLSIKYPIWGTRSIGIAEYKIGTKLTEVEILYTDKQGNRIYPHVYSMTTDRIVKYPVQVVRGIRLRVIPIADFDVRELVTK